MAPSFSVRMRPATTQPTNMPDPVSAPRAILQARARVGSAAGLGSASQVPLLLQRCLQAGKPAAQPARGSKSQALPGSCFPLHGFRLSRSNARPSSTPSLAGTSGRGCRRCRSALPPVVPGLHGGDAGGEVGRTIAQRQQRHAAQPRRQAHVLRGRTIPLMKEAPDPSSAPFPSFAVLQQCDRYPSLYPTAIF